MNRRIPNGGWCLFRLNPQGTRVGKVVLAKHRDINDPDLGQYTVKVYHSDKIYDEDGGWKHSKIILKPDSSDTAFEPIVIENAEEGEFEVIAEFVKMLTPADSDRIIKGSTQGELFDNGVNHSDDKYKSERSIYYFAYGRNMDCSEKEARTSSIHSAQRACLRGYRLAFNKKADKGGVYANIVSSAKDEVWGVLYKCSPQTLDALDGPEGVKGGHYRREVVSVQLDSGQTIQAQVYIATQKFIVPESVPNSAYLNHLLRGAKHYKLPTSYITKLESFREEICHHE